MTGYHDNDYALVNPQINTSAANLSSIQTRTFGKMAVAMIISAVVALFMAMNGIQFGLAFALIGLLAVVVLNMWLGAKIATAKPSTCYLMLGFESVYTGALLGGTSQGIFTRGGVRRIPCNRSVFRRTGDFRMDY